MAEADYVCRKGGKSEPIQSGSPTQRQIAGEQPWIVLACLVCNRLSPKHAEDCPWFNRLPAPDSMLPVEVVRASQKANLQAQIEELTRERDRIEQLGREKMIEREDWKETAHAESCEVELQRNRALAAEADRNAARSLITETVKWCEEEARSAGMMAAKARDDADIDGALVHGEAATVFRFCAAKLQGEA